MVPTAVASPGFPSRNVPRRPLHPCPHPLCLICSVREVLGDSSPSQAEKPALGYLLQSHLGVGQVANTSWAPPPSQSGQHLATPPYSSPVSCIPTGLDPRNQRETEVTSPPPEVNLPRQTLAMGYQGVQGGHIGLGPACPEMRPQFRKQVSFSHLVVLYKLSHSSFPR